MQPNLVNVRLAASRSHSPTQSKATRSEAPCDEDASLPPDSDLYGRHRKQLHIPAPCAWIAPVNRNGAPRGAPRDSSLRSDGSSISILERLWTARFTGKVEPGSLGVGRATRERWMSLLHGLPAELAASCPNGSLSIQALPGLANPISGRSRSRTHQHLPDFASHHPREAAGSKRTARYLL